MATSMFNADNTDQTSNSLDCYAHRPLRETAADAPAVWNDPRDRGWRSAGISGACDGAWAGPHWAPATRETPSAPIT
jgi:hypothetical protein